MLSGTGAGFVFTWVVMRHFRRLAREKARAILELARREAAVAAQEMKASAEEELGRIRAGDNREFDRREFEIEGKLREIRSHEESLALLDFQLDARQERLAREAAAIKQGRDAVREKSIALRKRLEGVANLDADEIRLALRDEVLLECQEELRALRKDVLDQSDVEVTYESQRILLTSMQRLSARPYHDITTTIINLPSEEMKGRIIGREGRNIKAFEAATGVTLMIDETPQTVLVSSFDPMRREIARLALEALVLDGRIHPASIEESVSKAKGEVDQHLLSVAHDTVARLRLNGIHPEILQTVGRLRFRFSMSQNVLDHSIEVAELCGVIASEIGLDPQVAKRAGLLHDMGKAISSENGGSHAAIGAEFARRLGETPIIVNAIAAHHDEVKPETLYAGLVILADSISAVRPGARAESMAAYVERLQKLEGIATCVPGVQQAFAIQAGREVRVLVQPDIVSDDQARDISRLIRKKIEEELKFPGAIKITVIREQRFTEIAT